MNCTGNRLSEVWNCSIPTPRSAAKQLQLRTGGLSLRDEPTPANNASCNVGYMASIGQWGPDMIPAELRNPHDVLALRTTRGGRRSPPAAVDLDAPFKVMHKTKKRPLRL